MSNCVKTTRWPAILIGLILFFLVLTGWSVFRATTRVSAVTNPGYYSHGLKYNRTLLERQAAEGLGWQIRIVLTGRRLEVRLTDREDRPVRNAEAELALFMDGEKKQNLLRLPEEGAGDYVAALPEGLSGQLSALLQINRRGANLSRPLLLNL